MSGPGATRRDAGRAEADSAVMHNVLSGTVGGHSVQAGSIHGGVAIHVHEVAPSTVPPNSLPPRPPHFVNRSRELAELDRLRSLSSDGVVPVLVLTGAGGVGKTAVALEWLHRLRAQFVHGQMYATWAVRR
ncbi:ATP-binding protein [Candidatus Protofrankia californiensis]|uniref:ATP-binding protein n=1 Tax=Candidatus Protofrankia californiensis TaxID=1839754 RepID=UPI00104171A5|nr:ATP-binding protein [Candidatus Protofrankia californiensis]